MARTLKSDRLLFLATLLLVGTSILMVYSASSYLAMTKYQNQYYFLFKQLAWAVIGLIALAASMKLDYRVYRHPTVIWSGLTIVFLALVAVLFMPARNGTSRWFALGSMTLQPSEFAKIALVIFSRLTTLGPAIALLVVFSLFVEMACGATYSIVPFVNDRALGSVSGIVGAGGNAGAVLAGFLFKAEAISWPTALFLLGILVTLASFATLLVQFEPATEAEEVGQPLPGVAGLAVES